MTLILFILILSILVFVHELGHFIAARKAGIKVEEFAFGLPFTKPIFSKKRGETVYSIYPLIFGGFVKLYGEDGGQKTEDGRQTAEDRRQKTEGAYFEKSIGRRTSVLLAGVFMNLLLGIVCFSILYFIWGIPTKTGKVIIEAVMENSPAEIAGLRPKDWIVAIEGNKLESSEDLIKISKERAGKQTQLEINREENNPCRGTGDERVLGGASTESLGFNCRGENLLVALIPRVEPPEGEGTLGVVITDTEFKKYLWYQMPYLGVREGFKESFGWGKMVLHSLGKMISSLISQGRIPREIAGPVGIYQITGQAAKAGWMAVLQFIGILSVNLAIINILPIPAVDGGRLIFLAYEVIFRKKANPKIEMWVNQIGMMILLGLMVLITINDVLRLAGK